MSFPIWDWPSGDAITEKFIVKSLSPFCQGRRAPVQQAIQALVAEKIICRDLEDDKDIHMGQRYRAALHSGSIENIRSLKPFGLLPFLRNFMDVVMSERQYSPFGYLITRTRGVVNKYLFVF